MTDGSISFAELIEEEKTLLLTAEEKYGEFFRNTINFIGLSNEFIIGIRPEGWIFGLFLGQLKKHTVLSFFSAIRKHHIQAMLDLRIVYESVCKALYGLAFPEVEKFVVEDERGVAFEREDLAKDCYKWLAENFPEGYESIKNQRRLINNSTAHANLIYAQQHSEVNIKDGKFEYNYFDKEDLDLIKADLWQIGNSLMGIMDLIYGVDNRHNKFITFTPDFIKKLKEYEKTNLELKQEMMKKERFNRFNENITNTKN